VCEDLKERSEAVRDDVSFVEYSVRTAPGQAARESDLALRTKLPLARVQGILTQLVDREQVIALAPKRYIHHQNASEIAARILELVGQHHRQSPESPGITLDPLREGLPLDHDVLDGMIRLLEHQGRLVPRRGRWAVPQHRATYREEDAQQFEMVKRQFRQQKFHPPGLAEIVEATGGPEAKIRKIVKTLCEHEELIQVADGMWFHREAVDEAGKILTDVLAQEGRLESVRFKYLLDTTRKFALPLLDYFDRIGVTRRDGNTRYPRRQHG
jgi:selenocysteine-specific elongation factor